MDSRTPRRILGIALLVTLALFAIAAIAQANVGGFEAADGNQTCDGATDWACLSLPIARVDDGAGASDDVFVSSSKEDVPNSWAFTTGDANDKGDIQAIWSSVAQNPDASAFLYLAFKRVSGTGQGFFSFELNQLKTTWTNAAGATIPCRTNGDVLVSYEIPSTGSQVALNLYKWSGSGGPANCPNGSTGTWQGPIAATLSEGSINASGPIDNMLSGFKPGIAFPTSTFGEAALDVSGIAQELSFAKSCEFFQGLQAHSRSSTSITSSLIDVVAPTSLTVPACKPPSGGGGGGGTTTPATPTITAQQACPAGTVQLGGVADPGDQVLVRDGGQVVDIVDADASTGAWSDTLSGVVDGSHSYTAQAVDAASNRSLESAAQAVTVDGSTCSSGGGSNTGGGDTGGGSNPAGGGTTPVTGSEPSSNPPATKANNELKLLGLPASCALKRFRSFVPDTKHKLRRVIFKVDGKVVAIARKRDKLGQFVATIDPTKMRVGGHKLTATLVYKQHGKRAKTVTKRFRHCDKCQSRRSFRIHIAKLHGDHVVRAVVYVNGKRVKVVRGKRLSAPVVLKGLPKGAFKVVIRATTAKGRTVTSTRTYHTCVATRLKGKRPAL